MFKIIDQKINKNFTSELPVDPIEENYIRQVRNSCFSYVNTKKPSNPELIHYSNSFLEDYNLEIGEFREFTNLISGSENFPNFRSYAMCYGGHQFGNWAGQLGDGRAITIADLLVNNSPLSLQLKGSGQTPYSRRADGIAVLRSSIREYLCSEAMHNLGIATTRALSIVKTGDHVLRDILYNGNPGYEQGAIVCRTSPSFIRFGNYEIFAATGDKENLQLLVDFTIKNYFPQLGEPSKETYLKFFAEVCNRSLELVLNWQRVGFVHGVLNTDNMSILGVTIDYGPYGWLEDYNKDWTPNTTDAHQKRYRFGNQPNIFLWNLTQLANALYPLIGEVESFESILLNFRQKYLEGYHHMMCSKLGIFHSSNVTNLFIEELEELLTKSELDMTIFFREISSTDLDIKSFLGIIEKASYLSTNDLIKGHDRWIKWFGEYSLALEKEDLKSAERVDAMKDINPKYVLRNYMAQLAIEEAEKGNYKLIDELYQLLLNPYDEQPEMVKWYAKRPEWAREKVGCSMLSCSS